MGCAFAAAVVGSVLELVPALVLVPVHGRGRGRMGELISMLMVLGRMLLVDVDVDDGLHDEDEGGDEEGGIVADAVVVGGGGDAVRKSMMEQESILIPEMGSVWALIVV